MEGERRHPSIRGKWDRGRGVEERRVCVSVYVDSRQHSEPRQCYSKLVNPNEIKRPNWIHCYCTSESFIRMQRSHKVTNILLRSLWVCSFTPDIFRNQRKNDRKSQTNKKAIEAKKRQRCFYHVVVSRAKVAPLFVIFFSPGCCSNLDWKEKQISPCLQVPEVPMTLKHFEYIRFVFSSFFALFHAYH